MNLKACTFERLAFISLGFGRGAQVGENFTFGSGTYFQGASVDVGRIHFFDLVRIGPWDVFTMRSEDSETAHLLGSGPVLRHNNACVRDVLTAPSNMYLNIGLNLLYSYF